MFQGRFPLDSATGYVATVLSGSDVPPYVRQNGLKIDSNGKVVVAGSGTVKTVHDALAFDSSDELLVSSNAAVTAIDGLNFDAGQFLLVTASPSSPIVVQNGLPIDANGMLCVTSAGGGAAQTLTTEGGSPITTESGVDITT